MAKNETIEEKLLRMKQQIDEAKSKIDQTKGALDQLHQRLKTEFGVDSAEEAQELISKIEIETQTLNKEINELVTQLEEDYEWD